MKYGPDIAGIASLIGDPARANMLTALMGGHALTASELATEAGITKQTASAHLAKLQDAAFIDVEKQGRHRYYRLSDHEVAQVLESLMGIAARRRPTRVRTGPKEPALRKARICYDHLAGELGVELFDELLRREYLTDKREEPAITSSGRSFFGEFGLDLEAMDRQRRPLCLKCLDWSVRRNHLAGGLGAAVLSRIYDLGWAERVDGTRIVAFSRPGEKAFRKHFGL